MSAPDEEGGTAPGKQADDERPLINVLHEIEHLPGRNHAGFVRHGMGGFAKLHALQNISMAVFYAHQAVRDAIAEDLLNSPRHGRRRLARPDDQNPRKVIKPVLSRARLQQFIGAGKMGMHASAGVHGAHRMPEDQLGSFSECS